ncbi:MAG TPA: peroxidase family protein, partial [Chitinophagales bacterium]|nr:peroxidase family protein [Chitinophagales bacterium]
AKPYKLHGPLLSYLANPATGKLTTPINPKTGLDDNTPSEKVPAFMTFVGQFVDHDLTQNLISLFDPQNGPDIENGASALIDLDSVYSRSNALTNGDEEDIMDANMKFRLRPVLDKDCKVIGYDHERNEKGVAYIRDMRNDENQMISQVHLFVERIHNRMMDEAIAALKKEKNCDDPLRKDELFKIYNKVRVEVIRNWQSFLWHDYLPTVVNSKSWAWVRTRLEDNARHFELDQKPHGGQLNMPHEFAISFRMGHTQLRDRYRVQTGGPEIPLFAPQDPTHLSDLTGGKALAPEHVIDWKYFAIKSKDRPFSNAIDTVVTNKVFDLPESTIPDNDKLVENLPKRNLVRSSQVDLSHGEFVYDNLKGMPELGKKLTIKEVEPDAEKQKLFRLDNDGNYDECNIFRTPLWYYVLREAEITQGGNHLGPLGGRIVAGVIGAAIYFSENSFKTSGCAEKLWKSSITKSEKVLFEDLVDYVLGK